MDAIQKIKAGDISSLDIKKLKGYEHVFRVRVGAFRIICEQDTSHGFIVIEVTRKNDTTYNF